MTVELHSPSTINDWSLSITCTVEGWRQRRGGDVIITDSGGKICARLHSTNQTCSRCGFSQSYTLYSSTRCGVDDQGKAIVTLALHSDWFYLTTNDVIPIGNWSCREEALGRITSNSFEIVGEDLLVRIDTL